MHTYHICEDNVNFKDACVVDTHHLPEQAVMEAGAKAAYWLGCVLPRSNTARRPLRVSTAECDHVIKGPLVEIMRNVGQAGVDGAGGKLGSTTFRCVGAGGAAVLFHPHKKHCVLCTAMIYSKVPGNQTVCRAEESALYIIIKVWPGDFHLTIPVDATYSLSGMDLARREKHIKGVNSDIWNLIYHELSSKALVAVMEKVKSHASIGQIIGLQNTEEMLILNEAADAAADICTDHAGDLQGELDDLRVQEDQLERV